MHEEGIGSRAALHIAGHGVGAPPGSASAEGWRPGQGQNVKIELSRRILPRILRRPRSGVSNNGSNATHNTTLVMTTPLYAFDKRKEAFRTKQKRLFTATMRGDNGDCCGGNRRRTGNRHIRRLA